MGRVIHKTQMTDTSVTITASQGAFKVLTVHEQDGIPAIFYETLEKPLIPVDVTFTSVLTGGDVPDHSVYVGTLHLESPRTSGPFYLMTVHIYQSPSLV
jgi:hypothetical protein